MKKVKILKKFWEKGKSKFLFFRPDLQSSIDYSISSDFKRKEADTIKANRERRFKKYGRA